jgi:arylsulfatase A-like enzyme
MAGGWKSLDKSQLPPKYRELIRDCYDNCLSYLDGQLGELFDMLERRGVLDQTLVIVTADHGEELGEHGLFEHGESLYRPEIHVPLLINLPGRGRSPEVVRETVSLRDLPATIADLVGMADGAPFPGSSLARLWRDVRPAGASRVRDDDGAISELSGPNPTNPSQGRSPASRGSLVSVAEGDYVYIRNEGDGREQLFHESDDPDEQVNLAKVAAMRPRLVRLRRRLNLEIVRHGIGRRLQSLPRKAPRNLLVFVSLYAISVYVTSYHSDYSSANFKSFTCTEIRNKLRKWDYTNNSSAKT